jgi:deoxyribodipyrimidine photo-lyase
MSQNQHPGRALVWYRSDLRTADHQPLREARRHSEAILAVFIAAPDQWARHDWGRVKADFVLRGVRSLAEQLAEMNIPLCYRQVKTFAEIPQLLLKLAQEHQCEKLFFEREYEVNELARDAAVRETFRDAGLSCESFDTQTILPPDSISTQENKPYSVFSPFRRRWLEHVYESADALSPQRRPNRCPRLWLEPDPIPLDVAEQLPGKAHADLWPAGEAEAARRLECFVEEHAAEYDTQRDFPAKSATSTLSPYLAAGMISARTCVAAAYEANREELDDGNKGLKSWISELVWREFYKHVLVSFPHVCRGKAFRREMDAIPWRDDDDAFKAWCEGRTGYPLVDAGMRELAETGWMHNRTRMVTAMFLSKHLLIDWRRGERHFARHLVDLDFASNNGGWQWSASTGTDAAPYFRIFNPFSQSKKCDPDGEYIRRYVPELAPVGRSEIHQPQSLFVDYPAPIVEHAAGRQRALDAFKTG